MAGVSAVIRVRALQPVRRRAGFSFGQADADIAPNQITRDQFDQLLADPQLVTGLAGTADEGLVVLTGMSADQIDELLEALDLVFPDEIVSEPLMSSDEDTGSTSAPLADLDPAAGAAGGATTPAAPAPEYQGGDGPSDDAETAAAVDADAGGEGAGGQNASATADTVATEPAAPAGSEVLSRTADDAATAQEAASAEDKQPADTVQPPVGAVAGSKEADNAAGSASATSSPTKPKPSGRKPKN